MNLRRKLERLSMPHVSGIHAHAPSLPGVLPDVLPTHATDEEAIGPTTHEALTPKQKSIEELRARMRAVIARTSAAVGTSNAVVGPPRLDVLPFVREHEDQDAPAAHLRSRSFDATGRHGTVPLHTALDATGETVATLSLDRGLAGFDPARALFLDTETTGLHGGTGMLPFLVGLGYFEGMTFKVEQLFMARPDDEPAILERVAARLAEKDSLVTFNGKSFDMPLLRARFVMSRMKPFAEKPHFDLVHAARRVYRARIESCRLTSLEQEVLGFVRTDDVPSGEIPARYVRYLRSGDPTPLLAVLEHNMWDIIAMAALLGEMSARLRADPACGRCEPSDMAGLATTAFRAGDKTLSQALAHQAAAQGRSSGDVRAVVRASRLAARIATQRGDWRNAITLLLDAVSIVPTDEQAHLSLARLYEQRANDPSRALAHARHAHEAEDAVARQKRIARLERKLRHEQLRLPGID